MKGQLTGQPCSMILETKCANSSSPIRMEIDSALNYQVLDEGSAPLLFFPLVIFGSYYYGIRDRF
ncbi:MAG: hypothetical protein CVU62_08410 [Deltaproteobacteria bacterium HGW-Deltaproteobacteria-2]|nr:MAG: hypothetical protein CVU62_08410 [Deltaproteobacteria bacterium HGW-Deltaproteobacteria-2]